MKITKDHIRARRYAVRDAAFAAHPEAAEKFTAQDEADWAAEAARIAARPEYAEAVASHGLERIVFQVQNWYATAEEAIARIAEAAADEIAARQADEAKAAKAALDAARKAAWGQIVSLAEEAPAGLPVQRDSVPIPCGAAPAKWAQSSRPSDDGMLSDGDGGQYYAGVSYTSLNTCSRVLRLREDWQARWNAAQSEEALAAIVAEFRAAVGITAAEIAAAEEAKRIAQDEDIRAAEIAAIRKMAFFSRKGPSTRGRSPWTRRASATHMADMAVMEGILASIMAVDCPTLRAKQEQEGYASQVRESIERFRVLAARASRMEGIMALGDAATPEQIRELLASGWLYSSESREWEERMALSISKASKNTTAAPAAFGSGAFAVL